jgi:hypothetical protein
MVALILVESNSTKKIVWKQIPFIFCLFPSRPVLAKSVTEAGDAGDGLWKITEEHAVRRARIESNL